jgi:predicted 2-oxoglutarate/Fe(II)-dependent dioxygenase YbiX
MRGSTKARAHVRSDWRRRIASSAPVVLAAADIAKARHVVEMQLTSILRRFHGQAPDVLAIKVVGRCFNAMEQLVGGGFGQLIASAVAVHAQMAESTEPLTPTEAAIAVLHRAAAFQLLKLKFAAPDSQAEELCASAARSGGARARALADAALDKSAIETLRKHGCVVRPRFLSPQDARALHAEFFALANEDGAHRFGPSVFEASRSASVNNAAGREFVVARAEDARMLGAPVIASTLEAIYALADGLGAAAKRARSSPPWWGESVRAPSRGMLQRYPPNARYDEHTDTDFLGDGWAAARAFTAIVYAHAGWEEGNGGELHVQPLAYEPGGIDGGSGSGGHTGGASPPETVVQPRGGTLVLFPSHLYHRVAPVTGRLARYAATAWLSLPDRADALDTSGVAAALTSSAWVSASADHARMTTASGGPLPGSAAAAKRVVERAQRRAMRSVLGACA